MILIKVSHTIIIKLVLTRFHVILHRATISAYVSVWKVMVTSSNRRIFALLAICAGIHWSLMNSPHKGQWRGALMICALNKRLSKQWWGWWFETPSRSLWRHCNVYIDFLAVCPHLVISVHFYPRPVLAFGYFHCLRLCVCVYVSVCVITKLGRKVQNTLVKVSTVCGVIDLDLQGQI